MSVEFAILRCMTTPPPPPRAGTPLRDRPIAGGRPERGAKGTVFVEVLIDDITRPGLLLQWRRTGAGWVGYTTYAVLDENNPVVVTQWLPATHIRQAPPNHPHHPIEPAM